MPSEFDIIRQYFSFKETRTDVILGIGDDAAILQVPVGHQLVQSVDTLVAGVHFPLETSPQDIAYKALAVNLSDMAAMGAEPAWFTLAITLPDSDETWLKDFSESLAMLAKKYNVQLVGGDTTHGPLTISISINGFVPKGKALTRSNAKVSDKVYVSGEIGDAALALLAWQGKCSLDKNTTEKLNLKLNRPEPKIDLGILLREYASACIDISDGLVADLTHITNASGVGARINFEKIPLSTELNSNLSEQSLITSVVLTGGDDYELCFTVPETKQNAFDKIMRDNNIKVSCIGDINAEGDVNCFHHDINVQLNNKGYNHFD